MMPLNMCYAEHPGISPLTLGTFFQRFVIIYISLKWVGKRNIFKIFLSFIKDIRVRIALYCTFDSMYYSKDLLHCFGTLKYSSRVPCSIAKLFRFGAVLLNCIALVPYCYIVWVLFSFAIVWLCYSIATLYIFDAVLLYCIALLQYCYII